MIKKGLLQVDDFQPFFPYIRIFSIDSSKYIFDKLLMTGCEPRSDDVCNDCSVNWATNTVTL